jgi:hypothetical protein
MSIKFICGCGKHLRAREEMAGRRTKCPACGRPVGIPFLRPTHPGGLIGPLSPAERVRNRLQQPGPFPVNEPAAPSTEVLVLPQRSTETAPGLGCTSGDPRRPGDADVIRLALATTSRRHRHEGRWYRCLSYPCRAVLVLLVLAAGLTVATGGITLLLPEVMEVRARPPLLVLGAPALLVPVVLLGYACGVLEGALTSGMAGVVGHVAWPSLLAAEALRTAVRWLACFLSGPVLPAAGGVLFALFCGDPTFLNGIIVVELAVMSAGYLFCTLIAVARAGGLAGANPARVAAVIHRLGYRALVLALAGGGVTVTAIALLLAAMERVHTAPAVGWSLLGATWFVSLFAATFLLRLLGVWYHHCRC